MNMNINHNMKQQNFGALILEPSCKNFLLRQGECELKNLDKIANEMKNFKHYDLVINYNGYNITPKDIFKQSYKEPVLSEFSHGISEVVEFKGLATRFADAGQIIKMHFNEKDYGNIFKFVEKAKSHLISDRYAAATELLETVANKDAARKKGREIKQEQVAKLVEDLISKFGVDV